ncbi:uncharacterized protein AB9W97_004529 [Spinachia spinachia]
MATDFTQDTLLHFLQSRGGSAKNSDLLLHFRNFIRDHADRNHNRELFKQFVNCVATVRQVDGVSYVFLRKKYKGQVHGGGERGSTEPRPSRPTSGKLAESTPKNATPKPACSAQKPQLKEVRTPGPSGVTGGKTILPAAGIMPNNNNNNNNNVATNMNLKELQEISTAGPGRVPADSPIPQRPEEKSVFMAQHIQVGQSRGGLGLPPGTTPVVVSLGETGQQVLVPQNARGKEACLQIEESLHHVPPLPHLQPQDTPQRMRYRPSYKTAVSYDDDDEKEQDVELEQRSTGVKWPSAKPLLDTVRPISASSPSIVDPHGLPAVFSSSPSASERRIPKVLVQNVETIVPGGPGRSMQSGAWLRGQCDGPGLEPVSGPEESTRSSLPLDEERYITSSVPHGNVSDHQYLHHVDVQAEPRTGRPRPAAVVNPIPQRTKAKNVFMAQYPAPGHHIQVGQSRGGLGLPPGTTPVVMSLGETGQQVLVPQNARGKEACLQIEESLHHVPPLPHLQPQDTPQRMRYRPSYKTAVSYDDDDDDEKEQRVKLGQRSTGVKCPPAKPLLDTIRPISASSPSIVDPHGLPAVFSSSPSASERRIPKVLVQNVETIVPGGPGRSMQSGAWLRGQCDGPGLEPVSGPEESTRSSLPLDDERYITSSVNHVDVQPEHRQRSNQRQRGGLSSSKSSVFSPSSYERGSDDQLSFGSHRGPGGTHNYEDSQARAGETVGGSQIQEVIQRAQGKKLESMSLHKSTGHLHDNQEATASLVPFHRSSDLLHEDLYSTGRKMPWHLSTGDLHDDREEAELSEGSTSSQTLRARRLSSKVRSRMCRSLGTNLDQLLQEEVRAGGGSEMARLNRLHLISSSLSLRYDLSSSSSLSSCCTPPRCPSPAYLNEGAEGIAGGSSPPTNSPPAQREGSSRQSLVPLEPREHAWMVKAAAGAWPDIYTMFREDSSLLNKQDFISGFTVLHWIAKHGDHRVLNTLWYGVQKAGLMFNINAKSTCGHTPLHVAAIHNSKNILRLLVTNFSADVKLRDTAGKRPWQYLSRAAAPDILQLLGAPLRPAAAGERRGVGIEDRDPVQHQQPRPRQRRRHHLSFASQGDRPPAMTGTTRVKRSSSIAAFLKHKSLQRFYGPHSDSLI